MDISRPHKDLQKAAADAMRAHGFEPEFAPDVEQQLAALAAHPPGRRPVPASATCAELPWSSIDNDTSRDLDQLEVAERLPGRRHQGPRGDRRRRRLRAEGLADRRSRGARTRRRCIPASGIFRCCPKRCRPARRRSSRARTGSPSSSSSSSTPDGTVQSSDVYRARRSQHRAADLRRRSAPGSREAVRRRRRWRRRRSCRRSCALQDARAQALQERPLPARRAQHRDDRDAPGRRRRAGGRRRAAGQEPRDRADRRLHDRLQRGRGAAAGGKRRLVDPARRARRRSAGIASWRWRRRSARRCRPRRIRRRSTSF